MLQAKYEDGILRLSVPKKEAKKQLKAINILLLKDNRFNQYINN